MNKTLSKEEISVNEHMEDLKERMRILQSDRKINIDILEANKSANREDIRRLREESKELRAKLAQLQRTVDAEDDTQEQRHVEKDLERMRRSHDELKSKSTRLRHELDLLIDQVKDLELESRRPHMEDNQYTRTIRALENKLDKAMIKYNEAQSIHKTYEQIVKRLKEERIGFDNQLQAIERTLQTKQKDYEELLLLAGDANHAREVALNELERVRAGYTEERKQREKELRESHQMVQVRRQMLERMKQREKLRNQLNGSGNGFNDSNLQQAVQNATANMIAKERIETRNKIDIFENAFRKIKEATGVSDVNEVIQKIVSQEGTTENLISLTRENSNKIETLNEQKRRLKLRVEEIKYSGIGGGHRRKMVDDHEDQLTNSTTRLERSKLKYERLSKGLISMKAGVGHLQDKIEGIRDEVGGKKIELTDESVTEVLRECELCLINIIKRYKAALEEQKRIKLFTESSGLMTSTSSADDPANESEVDLNASRPFNQRIELNLFDDDDGYGGNSNGISSSNNIGNGGYAPDENSIQDMDDDELTRDKVKRASHQILLAVDRKKRKPKKKNGNERGKTLNSTYEG